MLAPSLAPKLAFTCSRILSVSLVRDEMVKTRSDLKGVRVSAKAPRKLVNSSSGCSSGGRSSKKYEGGNSVCPRETPIWQKEITNFFPSKSSSDDTKTCETPSTSGTHE